jgi:hypothetical protein
MATRYRLPVYATSTGLATGRKDASPDGWFYPSNAAEDAAFRAAGFEADDLTTPNDNAYALSLPNGTRVFPDTSIANCQMSPHAGDRYDLFDGQEASIWVANNQYNMMYTLGGYLQYRSCPYNSDPTVPTNWSNPVSCIGNTFGGESGNCAHSFVYVEGSVLYCYYTQLSTQNVRVAIASISTPTVWAGNVTVFTGPYGGVSSNGNACVVKSNGVYYMMLESIFADTLTGEGFTNAWQVGVLSCVTPTGTFTNVVKPLLTMKPGYHGSASCGQLFFENGQWVHVFHGTGWGRTAFPTDLFVATSPSLTTDTWTLRNGGYPVGTRKTKWEVDQVADPFIVTGPNNIQYLFYEGADNRFPFFRMAVTALPPTWLLADAGVNPKRAGLGYTQPPPAAFDYAAGPWLITNEPWTSPQGHPGTATGTWAIDATLTGVPGGCRRYNSSNASTDTIQWEVQLSPGQWQFDLYYQKSPAGGIGRILMDSSNNSVSVNLTVDGSPSTVDTYAASVINYNKASFTFNVYGFEPMRRRLVFWVNSKNASSSGFTLADHGWCFTRMDF